MRILIIDDNPDIHKDFLKILKTKPVDEEADDKLLHLEHAIFGKTDAEISLPTFEIDTAMQGEEGIAKINHALQDGKPYSVAFVDVRMPPGLDGIETIKRIWQLDNSIQIVICTAYSDYSWEETVEELGERDNLLILKKPFDNITVRQLACALTKKWQLTQEAKAYTADLEQHIKDRTAELKHQATHDALTSLPNRVLINECLTKTISIAETSKNNFAVLFIDLDRFKLINDSLNHNAGDEVLKAVAKSLQKSLQPGDLLGRLGGDEFVIITKLLKAKREVQDFALRVLNQFNEPYKVQNFPVALTASIGIAMYPQDGQEPQDLIKNADRAMYHAKAQGANQFQFYSHNLDQTVIRRLEQEAELRQALAENQFYLVFQPQIDLETERLVSVEALVRWQHPTKGELLPLEFIPLAEETGLIIPLGEWIIRCACQQLQAWQAKDLPKVRVAVNITTKQIRLFNFATMVKQILQETKVDAKYLELELTENVLAHSLDVLHNLHELKKLGVQLSLDDFGTGFSGLAYMRNLPIDRIKIDQSYVKNIDSERGDEVIIEAILSMANNLNLHVTAEGVETTQQLNFLRYHQCREVQGFYFSKPLSSNKVERILEKMRGMIEVDD